MKVIHTAGRHLGQYCSEDDRLAEGVIRKKHIAKTSSCFAAETKKKPTLSRLTSQPDVLFPFVKQPDAMDCNTGMHLRQDVKEQKSYAF